MRLFRARSKFSSHSFVSGEGLSRYHVNCSNNSKDLRPAADILVNRAMEMRREIQDDAPLVILVGEHHKITSQKEFQHLVLARFLEAGVNFTFNVELPFNFLEMAHTIFPEELKYRICDFDYKGRAALSTYVGCFKPGNTPEAELDLMAFCYNSGLSVNFNDAARTGCFRYLDLNEPENKSFARKTWWFESGSHYVWNPNVMSHRNRTMVSRALKHARRAPVIIQQAGADHIFGSEISKYDYKHSLCAQFKAAGAHVLPVFMTSKLNICGINLIPVEAFTDLSRSVIIDGLNEEFFDRQGRPLSETASAQTPEELIHSIHKASSNEISFTDIAGNKEHYYNVALRDAEEVCYRAKLSLLRSRVYPAYAAA